MSTLGSILKASTQYTLLVFSAGFLCGMIRVPFILPMLGDRHAQLLEMPIMFLAMRRSARFIVNSLHHGEQEQETAKPSMLNFVAVGLLGLIQMVAAEMGLYLWMHWHEGKTFADWVRDRDAVAGSVFFAMLGIYAALPALVAQEQI